MTTSPTLDVDAYCERIGYTGPRTIHPNTLSAITACHASAIPFENLDVLLDRGIDITPDAVVEKIVRRRRGGYCFETNQLLMLALSAMGFHVKPLSARVRWMLPRDFIPPQTHMFLQVEFRGESWLTDCGVGGVSLSSAIRFEEGLVQSTPHDDRRLIRESGRWFHQVRFDSEWLDAAEFTGEEMPLIDRAIANWWTSTSPDSKFRKNLILASAGLDGSRRSLLNREFTLRLPSKAATKMQISSAEHLSELLDREFSLPSREHASLLFEKIRLS